MQINVIRNGWYKDYGMTIDYLMSCTLDEYNDIKEMITSHRKKLAVPEKDMTKKLEAEMKQVAKSAKKTANKVALRKK